MKSILIFSLSRSPWIGGIYYRKNILNMLLNNETVSSKYRYVVIVNEKYADIFQEFKDKIELFVVKNDINIFEATVYSFKCCVKYNVKYAFPLRPFKFLKIFGIIPVSWIADFQHCYYPQFFEKKEIDKRNKNFMQIARANNPLILSSYDAYSDLKKFFNSSRSNVHVVHFTSYIDNEKQFITNERCNEVLNKYGLSDERFCIICNQFWQHKNHKVVFKAIKKIAEENIDLNIKFAFTGELSDRRNPQYIDEIKALVNDVQIKEKIKLLGFIDRIEQLCLIKKADFIIQPSLFEGWGTVVEDCKCLAKPVILSDIDVHKEQMDNTSILFDRNSEDSLIKAILDMENRIGNINLQENNMTKEYAKALTKVFE